MRMKDKVCCRDQVQRGCDLCQQYRRQPNIELDIKNTPLEHIAMRSLCNVGDGPEI
jgi:hypothetical protein